MSKKFLTLNIGAASIELAEYDSGSKGALTLVNYGKAALPAGFDVSDAGAAIPAALGEIVHNTGIRPGPVAMSVSGQMAFQRFAAIPGGGGEERFEQLVRYEIEQNIPFPIDEMVCDRQILGDTENGDKSVMIVAAKIDQVEAMTSAVASAGFSPVLVDVAPIAITNALRMNRPEEAESCAVTLDIGAKTTSLVIAEGDRIYNRSIPVAGNAITKEISAALGCSPEDAEALKCERGYVSLGGVSEDEDEVADRISKVCRAVLSRLNAEISRSINFYRSQQGGSAPSKLYLTGGTSVLPQIGEFFSESLQIEVEQFNPFETVSVGPKIDVDALSYDAASLAATAGLAARMADAAHFAVNLLPPAIVAARAEKAKIPVVAAAGIAAVAALALATLAVWNETEVVEARREAVEAKVRVLKNFDDKVKAAEKELASETANADAVRGLLFSKAKTSTQINAVRASLAPGMWLQKFTPDGVTVRYWKDRVKGSGDKTPAELVAEKLKGKPVVVSESVKISDMSEIGKDAQVVQFTVELKFK